jgi:hypothetical protein
MKKFILLSMAGILGWSTQAQNISYKVTKNNPEAYHPRLSVNTVIAGIDVSLKNIDAMNFYVAAFGHYMVQDKIGVQFNAQTSILALGKISSKDQVSPKELNVGGVLFLNRRVKATKLKVDLKRQTNQVNNKTVETTTYIMVPGNVIKYNGVRGGFYTKNTAFNLDNDDSFDKNNLDAASMVNTGLYAGVISRRLSNLIVEATGYGKRFHSLGFDIYADALVQFSNTFTLREEPSGIFNTGYTNGQDITADVKKVFGTNTLGFRIGVNGFQIAPKEDTGKKFGMCYNFEAGMMPYVGYYLKGGIGLTLFKK